MTKNGLENVSETFRVQQEYKYGLQNGQKFQQSTNKKIDQNYQESKFDNKVTMRKNSSTGPGPYNVNEPSLENEEFDQYEAQILKILDSVRT